MPEKRLTPAHGRCFLSRSRCTVASSACCLLALALILVAAIGKLGTGNFLPLNIVLLVGGLGSLFSLCIGAACRRRKTPTTRGEPETGPRGPQLHVVTLMQRTRLDEQELARREWRIREEDRRQEKEQMERREKERLEVETTEGEQISFAGRRWRQDDTTIGEDRTDGWQHELLVVRNMGGEEARGSSSPIEPAAASAPIPKQVRVHVHQPG